jgi:filamentous hemagglutinin
LGQSTGGALSAALQTGMSQLLKQGGVALINNQGDLGKTFKALGSSASFKALASSMITAGLSSKLSSTSNLNGNPTQFNALQQLESKALNGLVSATVSSAMEGTEFGQALTANLKNAAIDTVQGVVANQIGNLYSAEQLNYVTHKLAHATLGCAVGAAANDDCGSGALGAVTGEMTAEAWFKRNLDAALSRGQLDDLKQQGLNVAELSSAIVATLAQKDVYLATRTAMTAVQNNFLKHAEQTALIEALNTCQKDTACITETITAFNEISAKNLQAELDTCSKQRGSAACKALVAEHEQALRSYQEGWNDQYLSTADNYAEVVIREYYLKAIDEKMQVTAAVTEAQFLDVALAANISPERAKELAVIAGAAAGVVGGKLPKKGTLTTAKTSTKTCSFHGDTQVLTASGYHAIRDLKAGKDQVWSRDERTGAMGWKPLEAQYSNPYSASVSVTLHDSETGETQTIVSNRIHPYFVQVPANDANPAPSSEGHTYHGAITRGQWVDAQYLKAGYRLLNPDESWTEVTQVVIKEEPLTAYNLTVADYHTYFVAGTEGVPAVWVHNNCWEELPDGYKTNGQKTTYGQEIFQNKEGTLVYKGNDGRYYNIDKYPPSNKSPNSGAMPENVTVQAKNGLPYRSNTKHTPGAPGGSGASGKAAGIEPENSLELFNQSVQIGDKRFAVSSDGNIHQFTDSNSADGWHWAGGTSDVRAPLPLNNKVKANLIKAFPELSKNKTFKGLTK